MRGRVGGFPSMGAGCPPSAAPLTTLTAAGPCSAACSAQGEVEAAGRCQSVRQTPVGGQGRGGAAPGSPCAPSRQVFGSRWGTCCHAFPPLHSRVWVCWCREQGSPRGTRRAWQSVLRAPLGCRPVRDCLVRRGGDSSPKTHGWMQPTLGRRCRLGRPGPVTPGDSSVLGRCPAVSPEDEPCLLCPGALQSGAKTCPRGYLERSAGTTSSTTRSGDTRTRSWPASLNPAA